MLWVKAAHIIAVICWFAGIFYLPRILVYFAASDDARTRDKLASMASNLYRFITPIAAIAVVLGLVLVTFNHEYYISAKWFWLKLVTVGGLLAYHWVCGRYVAAVRANTDEHSHVFFRLFNEIPVIFLLIIVILAVVKPL